ncbi:DUF4070 domain-containing protein [Holdemanella biformis]
MTDEINVDKLVSEYMDLFNSYYNPDFYINRYKEKMSGLLENKNGTK